MKKLMLLSVAGMLIMTSCVSKKDYMALEEKQKETQDLLNSATVKLNSCLADKAAAMARVETMKDQLEDLRKANQDLIDTKGNLTTLTQKGAENLEKSLESLKEKDLKISRLQDALSKKDSVTLAIVSSLKKEVGINDPDIEVNVEKGVVFISIADKLLFQSGSYNVTSKAKEVLAKVAKVINSKPDFEAMVEAHTDNVPYKKGVLLDNWDLSVKRATAVVRVLESLEVNPQQLVAAGRSYHVPLVANDTAENRAKNRRTRIVVLPKIDQFYEMIEEEMKNLSAAGN
ncbi:flagellar motor protein MotB [Psychroserpens sp.]|uniref:OmpA/MotB family protein n=1 Tax=Psychroserpens sp. TaxID=2020870 RepID=UPI001B0985A4|nr:OmpA family protein [Psychroserpens sp.]MBO6607449.1 OmpA family protein [Psychroserpens sp.]MBO6631772.1 OmpA family protein [Psychroserpens sp.]MBO6654473.1 OmpA family protein [Psychroserpens sp.]MBO6681178.1 OmpA family protein [Psychroserpens sp.]MBO6749865.1 OmpA family protein [Psychroserpens sp.]